MLNTMEKMNSMDVPNVTYVDNFFFRHSIALSNVISAVGSPDK